MAPMTRTSIAAASTGMTQPARVLSWAWVAHRGESAHHQSSDAEPECYESGRERQGSYPHGTVAQNSGILFA
jgi:hypothetical protein